MKCDRPYNLLYKIHDDLTDKKLLGTIATEEEKLLEEIRNDIESSDRQLIDYYQYKIDKYQELLRQIKELGQLLTSNNEFDKVL